MLGSKYVTELVNKHIGKIKALGLDRELNPGPPAFRTGVITAKLPRP